MVAYAEGKVSTHKVEVVTIKLEPHPNADALSVVRVFGGYTCCVRSSDFNDGDLAAYILPDSVVDTTRPEFSFLGEHSRIRAKKLRGVVSMGLLIHAPPGAQEGDDVADHFGVTHYEPPVSFIMGGDSEPAPAGYHPAYDVDSLRRYHHLFGPGEPVWVTEKIHGANGRFCFVDSKMCCGSKTMWKKREPGSIWWVALAQHPEIACFCEEHPDITVYGEVYGKVQNLNYGIKSGAMIAVFDLLRGTGWINPQEAVDLAPNLPWVPKVGEFAFDLGLILDCAEGPSLIPGAKHIREGIVVKPIAERQDPEIGRVCLKVVSSAYLEKP